MFKRKSFNDDSENYSENYKYKRLKETNNLFNNIIYMNVSMDTSVDTSMDTSIDTFINVSKKSINDLSLIDLSLIDLYIDKYCCIYHDNDKDLCKIYDCSGFTKKIIVNVNNYFT